MSANIDWWKEINVGESLNRMIVPSTLGDDTPSGPTIINVLVGCLQGSDSLVLPSYEVLEFQDRIPEMIVHIAYMTAFESA